MVQHSLISFLESVEYLLQLKKCVQQRRIKVTLVLFDQADQLADELCHEEIMVLGRQRH